MTRLGHALDLLIDLSLFYCFPGGVHKHDSFFVSWIGLMIHLMLNFGFDSPSLHVLCTSFQDGALP